MDKTYNFLTKPDLTVPEENIVKGEFKDTRNGIWCINPTKVGLDCYLNYLNLLNSIRDRWDNYGYLDMGMMPLAMGPSFIQSILLNVLTNKASEWHLKCYLMPPVSLLYESCKLPVQDIWVFKEDAAKVSGIPVDKITAERFLRKMASM